MGKSAGVGVGVGASLPAPLPLDLALARPWGLVFMGGKGAMEGLTVMQGGRGVVGRSLPATDKEAKL